MDSLPLVRTDSCDPCRLVGRREQGSDRAIRREAAFEVTWRVRCSNSAECRSCFSSRVASITGLASHPDFEPLRHSLSPEDGARSGPRWLKVAGSTSVAVRNGLKVDAENGPCCRR